MLSPAAMFIEAAADSLKTVPQWLKASQRKELASFGDTRAKALGATGLSEDFQVGYELGLATARKILAGSTALEMNGVKPSDVL